MTYIDFYKATIIETVNDTMDESLLQYVYTLFMAATPAETRPEDS